MTFTVTAAARTHVGLVRHRNEDSMYEGRSLFAVADGLGGHVGGDVASATVTNALQPYDRQFDDPAEASTALGRAVDAANRALRRRIEGEPEFDGMGTTLVAMLRSTTTAIVANVGDSRAYLRRDPDSGDPPIAQITEDHTYGHLVSEAATVPNLPDRLSRFLDGRPDGRSPDITTRELHPGDRYLLCSDGLSAVVPGNLIHDALNAPTEPAEAADHLIALATDHGGPDNITAIVIDVRDGQF